MGRDTVSRARPIATALRTVPSRSRRSTGGFCAFAVSRGYTADIDPAAWSIVDGKLYLNYSLRVQRTWEGDAAGNIRKADANWPTLRGKLEKEE